MSVKTIGIIVAVVAIAGGAYWYVSSQGHAPTAGDTNGTNSYAQSSGSSAASSGNSAADNGSFSGSVSDLIARGGSWQCTFDTTAAGGAKGVVYVSGSNIKGDFTSLANGTPVESHMIQTGGYTYVWSSLMPQGFKAKSTGAASAPSYGAPSGSGSDAMSQKYDYHCAPWAADASAFTPPANVQFMGY